MRLRRSLSPLLLGGASLAFGAGLALAAVEPVFSAADTYAQADPAVVQQGMDVIGGLLAGGPIWRCVTAPRPRMRFPTAASSPES